MTAAALLLALAALGLLAHAAWRDLHGEVRRLAAEGRLLTVGGGDVAFRDLPRAADLRKGHLLRDPFYAGEASWYPFLSPLLVAVQSRLTGHPLPESAFEVEVVMTTLFLAAVGLFAWRLCGRVALVLLPVAVLLGWLGPGHGLYPGQAARGPFLLVLLLLARAARDPRAVTPGLGFACGLAVGGLGLWHGASFVTAALVALIVFSPLLADLTRLREAKRRLLLLAAVGGGALLPLSCLFGPQLAHYGTLRTHTVARTWLSPEYAGTSLHEFLRLALLPRGVRLVLLLLLVIRVLWGERLRLARWAPAVPLLAAYAIALLFAHLGFLLADPEHRRLVRLARNLLPAPPHTFAALADDCAPLVSIAGLFALGALVRAFAVHTEAGARALGALTRTFPASALRLPPALRAALPGLLGIVLNGAVIFRLPPIPPRFAASDTLAFHRFAEQVGATVGDAPVFLRSPGRFLQSTSIKLLVLGVKEYANHYVQAERQRAKGQIDVALAIGRPGDAEELLRAYDVRFVMEVPWRPDDPVVVHCAGPPLIAQDGYVLHPFVGCRP